MNEKLIWPFSGFKRKSSRWSIVVPFHGRVFSTCRKTEWAWLSVRRTERSTWPQSTYWPWSTRRQSCFEAGTDRTRYTACVTTPWIEPMCTAPTTQRAINTTQQWLSYTLWVKKLCHFYFYCNFGKCWSIFKILSSFFLTHSVYTSYRIFAVSAFLPFVSRCFSSPHPLKFRHPLLTASTESNIKRWPDISPQRQLARPTRPRWGVAPLAFQLCPTETFAVVNHCCLFSWVPGTNRYSPKVWLITLDNQLALCLSGANLWMGRID